MMHGAVTRSSKLKTRVLFALCFGSETLLSIVNESHYTEVAQMLKKAGAK